MYKQFAIGVIVLAIAVGWFTRTTTPDAPAPVVVEKDAPSSHPSNTGSTGAYSSASTYSRVDATAPSPMAAQPSVDLSSVPSWQDAPPPQEQPQPAPIQYGPHGEEIPPGTALLDTTP